MRTSHNTGRVRAILLLGSNIQPEEHLPKAAGELAKIFKVLKVSGVWETAAVGSAGPKFLNAAILVETDLSPDEIKHTVLRPLEARLGRRRTGDKFAPRSIDIDLLSWDDLVWEPHAWEHAYVAVPSAELCPELRLGQTGESLAEVAQRIKETSPATLRPDVSLFKNP